VTVPAGSSEGPLSEAATVSEGSVAEARLISSTFQGHIKIEANGYPEGVLPWGFCSRGR